MPSWLFSLQVRLVVGFTLVLALALGSIGWYVGFAAQREAERFQEEVEAARAARVEQLVSRFYSTRQEWSGLQAALEQAGALYGWRIVVTDQGGNIVGDSHTALGAPTGMMGRMIEQKTGRGIRIPVLRNGRQVAVAVVEPVAL
ncbi:MAG: hypothetical protein HW388_1626, partial [Dehalococcoidia bacterium]|nr:hypothetical protein [Dehalococcoidia bacterium]